jgi:hypothetical protein
MLINDPDHENVFTFSDEHADAIHETIKESLLPDIQWGIQLGHIATDIGCTRKYAHVLYTGEINRRMENLEAKLEAVLDAYDQLGGPLQWHFRRQASVYLPVPYNDLDPTLPGAINAVLDAVRQARRRPFDHQYVCEQKRGAPVDHMMVLIVSHLLHSFEWMTGIKPTVYSSAHADGGYRGTAYPFIFACLSPINLIPRRQLPSSILAVYRQARPALLSLREQFKQFQDDNALRQGSTPPQDSKK